MPVVVPMTRQPKAPLVVVEPFEMMFPKFVMLIARVRVRAKMVTVDDDMLRRAVMKHRNCRLAGMRLPLGRRGFCRSGSIFLRLLRRYFLGASGRQCQSNGDDASQEREVRRKSTWQDRYPLRSRGRRYQTIVTFYPALRSVIVVQPGALVSRPSIAVADGV